MILKVPNIGEIELNEPLPNDLCFEEADYISSLFNFLIQKKDNLKGLFRRINE